MGNVSKKQPKGKKTDEDHQWVFNTVRKSPMNYFDSNRTNTAILLDQSALGGVKYLPFPYSKALLNWCKRTGQTHIKTINDNVFR